MHSVFALWTEYGTLRCPQFSLRGAQCARDGWPKAARTGMDGRFAKRIETDVTRHCECMLDRLRYTCHVPSMVAVATLATKVGETSEAVQKGLSSCCESSVNGICLDRWLSGSLLLTLRRVFLAGIVLQQ